MLLGISFRVGPVGDTFFTCSLGIGIHPTIHFPSDGKGDFRGSDSYTAGGDAHLLCLNFCALSLAWPCVFI